MKANDLMTGDIVRVAKDVCLKKGTVVIVHGIDADNRFTERGLIGSATCIAVDDEDRTSWGIWTEFLEPIPLTPEILEKNGFVEDKSVGYCERYIWADSMRLPQTVVEFSFGDDGATMLNCWIKLNDGENNIHICDPSYVHQLQHALRLCGIEKEIIL